MRAPGTITPGAKKTHRQWSVPAKTEKVAWSLPVHGIVAMAYGASARGSQWTTIPALAGLRPPEWPPAYAASTPATNSEVA